MRSTLLPGSSKCAVVTGSGASLKVAQDTHVNPCGLAPYIPTSSYASYAWQLTDLCC